jgi:hypothetical protein
MHLRVATLLASSNHEHVDTSVVDVFKIVIMPTDVMRLVLCKQGLKALNEALFRAILAGTPDGEVA